MKKLNSIISLAPLLHLRYNIYRTLLTSLWAIIGPFLIYELEKSMKVVITNPPGTHTSTATGQPPITNNRELLIKTLRAAAARAAQQQRTILASFTQPFEWCDTLQAFTGARQAALGECFFWEQPAEQTALVGVGAVTTIATMGSACFTASASAWRTLMDDAVITSAPATQPAPGLGPVLFGGFAFDPLSPRTQLWATFPADCLFYPVSS